MVRGTGEWETRLVCLARALNKECVLFYPSPPPPPLPRPLLLLFCFPFPSLVGVTWTDENALIRRYGSRYAEYHDIPVEYVYAWMEINGVAEKPQEEFGPYETVNS